MFSYVHKGEWLELRSNKEQLSPDQWVAVLHQDYHIPEALLGKLKREDGLIWDGRRLRLRLFPEEQAGIEPEWMDLQVLYEDDFCLVVHKPHGMPVHPSAPGQKGTMAHGVASYYQSTGQMCRIRHIHRLDEDTTGPVLYAKNEMAHILLDRSMREKAVQRIYWAVVQGRLNPPEGVVDQPIGKDRHQPKRRRVSPGGEPARTRYRTVGTAPAASLVELQLETGRTHQIRVHMQHLGAPLIGDALYGGALEMFRRQALHGVKLQFPHPWLGEMITVADDPPDDFMHLWEQLRSGARP
ncbi:MAG: RluA family pseudouridine synthase [Paenibacillaceae bacterium]|nr:RluA family pseudouridine synthase [Paenibacillaceae bacterium]